jgi:hypothetical protein
MGTTAPTKAKTNIEPDRGEVTWKSEGTEGGKHHSRRLHVPTDSSGLTLGRGYDMSKRQPADIISDLTRAGVVLKDAQTLSGAAGLTGDEARRFIRDHKLEKFEISLLGQKMLFESAYDDEAAEAERLCSKDDVTDTYGDCDWEKLDPAIRDILVDMKFRGDYTGAARTRIQKYVVANDLEAFAKALEKRSDWPNVPKDRFNLRVAFLKKALAERKAKSPVAVTSKPTPSAALAKPSAAPQVLPNMKQAPPGPLGVGPKINIP